MIERKTFTILKYSLLPAGVRLPNGRSNRRFEFQKRSQLFILVHKETLSVVAVRVCNPDRSSVRINRMASSQRVMFSGAKRL